MHTTQQWRLGLLSTPRILCPRDGAGGVTRVGVLARPQVNRSTSQVDCQVTGLALDELELASLRGTVQEAALHVNFDTRMGRGNLKVAGPRFSGLQVCRSWSQ